MKQRGAMLLQTEEWSDCTLVMGPKAVPVRAHKLMLAMASPVFESLFYYDSLDNTDTFRIPDVKPKTLKALLNYIYTENISISSFKKAYKLYMAANKYLIPQLARVCAEYMCCNLSMETACLAYQAGCEHQDHMLMYESLQIIKLNIRDILHHKSFEELDLATVVSILGKEDICVEELELYRAVEKYAHAHLTRKRGSSASNGDPQSEPVYCPSIRKALEQIRFLTMSLQEFAQGPARAGLLTPGEALAVMVAIAGAETQLPAGFSTSRTPRYIRPPSSTPAPGPEQGVVRVSLRASDEALQSASAPLQLQRLWTLRVLPVLHTTTYNHRQDYLGVFLSCSDPEPAPWACAVHCTVTLEAAAGDHHTCSIDRTYSSTQREHGAPQFVRRELALQRFVRDGRLCFQARVVVRRADSNV
ncbi:BTB/POZ domain-containing protein 3-like isoform X2 [Pectinophora gossypiella]|nr:BTB/POZ domain-containing protein 3-like isoform X2 [Pectinophora gossypiella]